MIFSNLAGTTSDEFKIGADGKGQIQCNNTYDLFWGGWNTKGGRNPNVTQLTFGTDLNNIRTPGQYFAEGMTNEYPNCPTGNGFLMTVEPTGGITYPNYVTQRLYDYAGSLHVRTRSGGGWGEWRKIAYKSDVPEFSTGTWNPTLSSNEFLISQILNNNYYKYGNIIILNCSMQIKKMSDNGAFITITGLPFNITSDICSQVSVASSSSMIGINGATFVIARRNHYGNGFFFVVEHWENGVTPGEKAFGSVMPLGATVSTEITLIYMYK